MRYALRAAQTLSLTIASTGAFGQANDGCDSVLQLAGREQSIEISDEMFEEYSKSSSHSKRASNSGANFSDGMNAAGFKSKKESSNSTSSEQFQTWKRQYFQSLDRVFAPAVDAWLACKSNKAITFKPTFIDSREINVSLLSGVGEQRLTGVDTDAGVTCKRGTSTLGPGSSVKLDHNALSIICKRTDTSTGPKVVRINTNAGTNRLTMPAVVAPLIEYDAASSQLLLSLSNCAQLQTLAPSARPRQLHVGFAMYTSGSTGSAKVFVNDVLVTESTGTRPAGNPNWMTNRSESTVNIPAGLPIAVHAIGYNDHPGKCHYIEGQVRESKSQADSKPTYKKTQQPNRKSG